MLPPRIGFSTLPERETSFLASLRFNREQRSLPLLSCKPTSLRGHRSEIVKTSRSFSTTRETPVTSTTPVGGAEGPAASSRNDPF